MPLPRLYSALIPTTPTCGRLPNLTHHPHNLTLQVPSRFLCFQLPDPIPLQHHLLHPGQNSGAPGPHMGPQPSPLPSSSHSLCRHGRPRGLATFAFFQACPLQAPPLCLHPLATLTRVPAGLGSAPFHSQLNHTHVPEAPILKPTRHPLLPGAPSFQPLLVCSSQSPSGPRQFSTCTPASLLPSLHPLSTPPLPSAAWHPLPLLQAPLTACSCCSSAPQPQRSLLPGGPGWESGVRGQRSCSAAVRVGPWRPPAAPLRVP